MPNEDALDHSRETRHLLNNHIQLTQIKLDNLEQAGQSRHDALTAAGDARHAAVNASITRLENALKWAGGLIVSLVLTVLGWAVVQQINANEAQRADMARQIELLRQAQQQQKPSHPAGAPETALTAPALAK